MAISLYSLAPFLGPTIGPVAAAWIAQKSVWRWIFWSTSIFSGLVQVLGFFFLKESAYTGIIVWKTANRPRLQHTHQSCWNARQRQSRKPLVTRNQGASNGK